MNFPQPPAALVSLFVGLFAVDLPRVPALSEDPSIIAIVDVIRVVMLILGLTVAGVCVRHLRVAEAYSHSALFVTGYRWRLAAMIVACIYVCSSAYDRVGQPVTINFVFALVFLLVALRSVHIAASIEPLSSPGVEALRDFEPPTRVAPSRSGPDA